MSVTSMSEACRRYFEKLPMNWEFTGADLRREVRREYPPCQNSLGETFTRRLRGNRYGSNYQIICISAPRSLYKKVPVKAGKK